MLHYPYPSDVFTKCFYAREIKEYLGMCVLGFGLEFGLQTLTLVSECKIFNT